MSEWRAYYGKTMTFIVAGLYVLWFFEGSWIWLDALVAILAYHMMKDFWHYETHHTMWETMHDRIGSEAE